MTKAVERLQARFLEQLADREVVAGADSGAAAERFVNGAISGNHVQVSGDDGKVHFFVPYDELFDTPPDRLEFFNPDNHAKKANFVQQGTVTANGVSFAEFVVDPDKVGQLASAASGKRPMVAMCGVGADNQPTWENITRDDGCFYVDARMLEFIGGHDEVEIRPDVAIDPRDPSWVALDDAQWQALELKAGHPTYRVVRRSVVQQVLHPEADDTAEAAATEGLTALLDESTVESVAEQSPAELAKDAIAEQAEVLARHLGDYANPAVLPDPLVELALQTLNDNHDQDGVDTLMRAASGTGGVTLEQVAEAIDRAFGRGFMASRQVSLWLVDALLAHRPDDMSLSDGLRLRSLRFDLQYARDLNRFGPELAHRPKHTTNADQHLLELMQYLGEGTSIDEGLLMRLAKRLQTLSFDSTKTNLLVLCGEDAGDIQEVEARIMQVLRQDADIVEVNGADTLRGHDPVGMLTGTINDAPNSPGGVWTRHLDQGDKRFVTLLKDLEGVGTGVAQGPNREKAVENLYRFVMQVHRDGGFRGFDPTLADAERGAAVDTSGGVMVLRTAQTKAQLRQSLPPALWAKVSPFVFQLERGNADSVVDAYESTLERHMQRMGFVDAQVQFSPAVRELMTQALELGLSGDQLYALTLDDLKGRLFGAQADGNLGQRVFIDLNLLDLEHEEAVKSWLAGEVYQPFGASSLFRVLDTGRYTPDGVYVPTAQLQTQLQTDGELGQARRQLFKFQAERAELDVELDKAAAINQRLHSALDAAEAFKVEAEIANDGLRQEVERLERLKQRAQARIDKLEGALDVANEQIQTQKDALGEQSEALKRLRQNRDEIKATLSHERAEFNRNMRAMGQSLGGGSGDPGVAFNRIVERAAELRAQGVDGSAAHSILAQGFKVASARMVQHLAAQLRNGGRGLAAEARRLEPGYSQAAIAAGVSPAYSTKALALLNACKQVPSSGLGSYRSSVWRQVENALRVCNQQAPVSAKDAVRRAKESGDWEPRPNTFGEAVKNQLDKLGNTFRSALGG